MRGVFGGLLGLINGVGKATLYLLIGEAAKRESTNARRVRLILGSIITGEILSVIVYLLFYTSSDDPTPLFFVSPTLFLATVIILETIRLKIENSKE